MKKAFLFTLIITSFLSFTETGYVDEISIDKEKLKEKIIKIRGQFEENPLETMYNIGTFAVMYGAYDEGLAQFKEILKENSDDKKIAVRAHLGIVYMLMKKEEYEEAIKEASLIIRRYPQTEEAILSTLHIAECYEKLLNWDEAELNYRAIIEGLQITTVKVAKDDPITMGIVYQKLGKVLFNKNKYKESIESFNKGFKLLEGKEKDLFSQTLDILAESQYLLGESYLKTNKIEEAKHAFQMVIERYPHSKWQEEARERIKKKKKEKGKEEEEEKKEEEEE